MALETTQKLVISLGPLTFIEHLEVLLLVVASIPAMLLAVLAGFDDDDDLLGRRRFVHFLA